MAWFDCSVGGSGRAEIIVNCSSDFAGVTITCTNGTNTYTQTCPSVSPYTVTFKVKADTWTISGVVGGVTYSDIVDTTAFTADLVVPVSFTLYSAPYDTVYYYYNGAKTVLGATDANGELMASLSEGAYILESLVAKNPNNLSNAYTKSVTVTNGMGTVYLMPDNALYWYGFQKEEMEFARDLNAGSGTYNTNNFTISKYAATSVNGFRFNTKNPMNLTPFTKLNAIVVYGDTTSYMQNLGYEATLGLGWQPDGYADIVPSTAVQKATYNLPSNLGLKYPIYFTNCFPLSTTIYAMYLE